MSSEDNLSESAKTIQAPEESKLEGKWKVLWLLSLAELLARLRSSQPEQKQIADVEHSDGTQPAAAAMAIKTNINQQQNTVGSVRPSVTKLAGIPNHRRAGEKVFQRARSSLKSLTRGVSKL